MRVRDTLSSLLPVTSGVPQGSVLGPLLFAIYINDMPDFLADCDCYLFADDSKLLCHAVDDHSLNSCMQNEVNVFSRWSETNKMEFNLSKCKVIDFSFKPDSIIGINILGADIEAVDVIKDLGLYVDHKLNWKVHIDKKTASALRVFYMMKNTIPFCSLRQTRLNLYISCVLSIVMYASQVWSPDATSLKKLESIQIRAVKWITGSKHYAKNLYCLGILPIAYLLHFYDLCYFNKLLNYCYDIDPYDYISVLYPSAGLRSQYTFKFVAKPTKKRHTERSYFNRVVKTANSMLSSSDIDFFTPPESFRKNFENLPPNADKEQVH